jgi:4-amino-4-deoxy-L-arabinose transferase-like glycosyltransferase
LIAGFIPIVVLWMRKVKADSALVGSIVLSFIISLILIITGFLKSFLSYALKTSEIIPAFIGTS